MTDFDRAVLTWLDTATVTDRARNVTLGRTSVGIQSYAELIRGDDSTAAIPVDTIRLDIGLKDVVARAQRRLEDGQPMQLGNLPPPPPAPQTLMSARSSVTTGPNMRRTGVPLSSSSASQQQQQPQQSGRQSQASSRQQSVNLQNQYPSNNNNRHSMSRSGTNNSNLNGGGGGVPLSARSGVLASARGEQPSRPAGVPPLKFGAGGNSRQQQTGANSRVGGGVNRR